MKNKYLAVVIGSSAGGMVALSAILSGIKKHFFLPVFIVQHTSPDADNYLAKHLDKLSEISVKEAEDKEKVCRGTVYIAPPNYHILIEKDETITLSVDPKVNYARPSVDVLFESAAEVYGKNLIGIVLTGANHDGAKGLKFIKELGGMAIVQNPETAEIGVMPAAAIKETKVDHILNLEEICHLLNQVNND